jgi:hypothetical protein
MCSLPDAIRVIKSRKIPVAERSEARVCGRSLAGIAGLNPAGDLLCVVR